MLGLIFLITAVCVSMLFATLLDPRKPGKRHPLDRQKLRKRPRLVNKLDGESLYRD